MIELYVRKLYKELQTKVKGKIIIKYSSAMGSLVIRIKYRSVEYVKEVENIEEAISTGYSVHLCAMLCCTEYKDFLVNKFFK